MSNTVTTTTGIGSDVIIPSPNAFPESPKEFRYEKTGTLKGYLVWKRDTDPDMVGGKYQLRRSTTFDGTYIQKKTISNPTTGATVSTQDTTATAGDFWKLRAVNVSGNTSDWSGPVKLEKQADKCRLQVYLPDFALEQYADVILSAVANTAEDYVTRDGYQVIPTPRVSKKVEDNSFRIELLLIPSAEILDSSGVAVNYNIKLITPDKAITFNDITVPQQSQKFFSELI